MAVPTIVSATINVAANTLTIVWSEAVNDGAPDYGLFMGFGVGNTVVGYLSGNGTSAIVYEVSLAVAPLSTIDIPTDAVISVSTADPNATITDQPLTTYIPAERSATKAAVQHAAYINNRILAV